MPISFGSTYHSVVARGGVREGKTVVIQATAGGVVDLSPSKEKQLFEVEYALSLIVRCSMRFIRIGGCLR